MRTGDVVEMVKDWGSAHEGRIGVLQAHGYGIAKNAALIWFGESKLGNNSVWVPRDTFTIIESVIGRLRGIHKGDRTPYPRELMT